MLCRNMNMHQYWATAYAKGRPGNLHLDLEDIVITYIGRWGMLWKDFDRTIQERLKSLETQLYWSCHLSALGSGHFYKSAKNI